MELELSEASSDFVSGVDFDDTYLKFTNDLSKLHGFLSYA